MEKKLITSIQKEIIEAANDKKIRSSDQLTPRVQRLRGIIKIDRLLNYKQSFQEELAKQFGK